MPAAAPKILKGLTLEDIRAALARKSLAAFVRQGWHVLEPDTPLEWNWHHEAICLHVQAVLEDWLRNKRDPSYRQRARRLLINVPPGTGKSRLVSVYTPAWMWLHDPSWRVLCLSASPSVALRDAMLSRELIESDWYRQTFRIRWTLAEDQNAKGLYKNTHGGFRRSAGWGTKITGERADCILVDDPHDAEEAKSDAKRQGVIDRWVSSIENRVNDQRTSVRIGIMQRVHEQDWSGHVLKSGGWEHLCLPLEYEPQRYREGAKDYIPPRTFLGWSDPRTEPGEILHPARFPPNVVEAEKRKGSLYYAGQAQQRPAPVEGGMFKRRFWRFWKPDGLAPDQSYARPEGCVTPEEFPAVPLPPKFHMELMSLDCAFKGNPTNDRVAAVVAGVWQANIYLLEVVAKQRTFTETLALIEDLARRYPRAHRKLVEDKANGPAVINSLQNKIRGLIAVNPEGGKEARAAASQPVIESGNVYLREGAPWLHEFVYELATFPNGAYDDIVDALTQLIIDIQDNEAAKFAAMAKL